MILILSNKWDLTIDFIVAELRARGCDFLRINTEDLASGQATICLPDLRILASKRGEVYDLTRAVNVIWNRRPGKPFDDIPRSARPSPATQNFVNDQWFSWLEALQLIPDVMWINHPQANDAMENKARQLLVASRIGFQIPETAITNDPDEARQLAKRHGNRLVAKALYSPLIEEPDEDFFVFTNEITAADLAAEEEIRISPCIFQQSLSPKIDYRVTVVGETVFPVRVERQNRKSSHIDWRSEKSELRFIACSLPPEVEDLCRKYVKASDLVFGAIDLVEHNGSFFFLEINPNGEWGWLQKPNNIPIAEALCDLMISYDREKGI
jgi:glutathione synthase/RimK-type ligase-like ATP-grasp enzyme